MNFFFLFANEINIFTVQIKTYSTSVTSGLIETVFECLKFTCIGLLQPYLSTDQEIDYIPVHVHFCKKIIPCCITAPPSNIKL